jgi:WD40 repeat protein
MEKVVQMDPFDNKFRRNLIVILIVIYIVLSLPIGSSPDGPEAVKVSYPYNYNVGTLDFSPDGKLLAAGYEEGYVRVWNIQNGEDIYDPENVMEKERLMRTFGRHDITRVTSVDFSPDGKYVLSGGYLSKYEYYDNKFNERTGREQDISEIKLWSVESGNCTRTHYMENNDVESVAFSPDGKSYAASYQNDQSRGTTTIYVWSTETGEVLNSITSPDYTVQSLKFSPDGNYLVVSYSGNPRIVFWNLESMSAARVINTHGIIRDLDFSDDGRILAGISDHNGHITIWDTATGDVLRTLFALQGLFANMDLSPDGKYVASIRSNNMAIWNVSSGRAVLDISSLPEVGDRIDFTCLQFSPDMEYLAAGVEVPHTAYSLSLDDYMKAYDNVSDDVLSKLYGNTPIFLWDFQDIEEGGYIESFWDEQRDSPLFWVIALWAPMIVVSYWVVLVISAIIKAKKAK